MRDIRIAVNVCTYRREKNVRNIIEKLQGSSFFAGERKSIYTGALYLFVVDNAGELEEIMSEYIRLKHNPKGNTGGSGGYQYGIELIRESETDFTHVIFMDDDVEFELDCFYRLFDFLRMVDEENADRPVAGRMIRMDNPVVQYTAAEIWHCGHIEHIGFNKALCEVEREPAVEYNSGAEYGGWWFCCFPYSFVEKNDIMPLFMHCDDVEYGLRCRRSPIILKGVQVRHETFEHRMTPLICYYDIRNPLYVNEKHGLVTDYRKVLADWKAKISVYHLHREWSYEYHAIRAMYDFLKGTKWLYRINPGRYHQKLQKVRSSRYKNAIFWRITEIWFRKKYGIGRLSPKMEGGEEDEKKDRAHEDTDL